jgi:hypothetical protein
MEREGSLPCSLQRTTGSYSEPEKSSPHSDTLFILRSILILSSHQCMRPQNGLVPSGFPPKILYSFLISHMRDTLLAHFIFLDLITVILHLVMWVCRLLVTSRVWGPNSLLSTMWIASTSYCYYVIKPMLSVLFCAPHDGERRILVLIVKHTECVPSTHAVIVINTVVEELCYMCYLSNLN